MTKALYTPRLTHALLIALITAAPAFAQPGHGCSGMTGHGCHGMMGDSAHASDMQVFHQLLAHRAEITRQVVLRQDGIETVTESTNAEVTRLIQTHVAAMLARVEEERPIHRRDPLFAELFRYASRIEARHERTANGVRVVETSQDAYVVKLLQAHAEVVSAFIANGMSEMMKNHPLPPREP
jgi:hypothetical protein